MKISVSFESGIGNQFQIQQVWICDGEFHVLSTLSVVHGITFASLETIGDDVAFSFEGKKLPVKHYLITNENIPSKMKTYEPNRYYKAMILDNIYDLPHNVLDHGQILFCREDRDETLEKIADDKETQTQLPVPKKETLRNTAPLSHTHYSGLTLFSIGVGVGFAAASLLNGQPALLNRK